MKKIRVNLKRNKKKWSFVLFDSSESAFYLKDESLTEGVDDYYKIVTLLPGEIMEVEWLGSEYIYKDEYHPDPTRTVSSQHEKFDKIRLAKMLPVKTKVHSTGYVETLSGWTIGTTFNWCFNDAKNDIKITQIINGVDDQMDFEKLFLGHQKSEEEKELDEMFANSKDPLN